MGTKMKTEDGKTIIRGEMVYDRYSTPEKCYVVITELYKAHEPIMKGQAKYSYFGVSETYTPSIFGDKLVSRQKFVAREDGECYEFREANKHFPGTSTVLRKFLSSSNETDDFIDLISKSDRVV